jgi:hypothetical protein
VSATIRQSSCELTGIVGLTWVTDGVSETTFRFMSEAKFSSVDGVGEKKSIHGSH